MKVDLLGKLVWGVLGMARQRFALQARNRQRVSWRALVHVASHSAGSSRALLHALKDRLPDVPVAGPAKERNFTNQLRPDPAHDLFGFGRATFLLAAR